MYTCIEERSFSDKLDELRKIHHRLDDVWRGVQWYIIRNPLAGRQLPETPHFRVYQSYPIGDTPSFWFLYEFHDDEEVILFHSLTPVDCELEEL